MHVGGSMRLADQRPLGESAQPEPGFPFRYCLLPNEDMQNYLGATGGQLFNQDHFDKTALKDAFGSRQSEIALALKPNDFPRIAMSRPDIIGDDRLRFMKDGATHMGSMVGVCEDLPQRDNRVELEDRKE